MIRCRALTLVQALVVFAILALLSAMTYPLIRSQVDKAKERTCMSNLKQLYGAIMLYREAQDGSVPYGRQEAMGLPPTLMQLQTAGLANLRELRCALPRRNYSMGAYVIMYPARGADGILPPWIEYVMKYKDDSILIADMNHDPAVHAIAMYQTHYGIGLYLGGHVRVVQGLGSPTDRTWWNPD